MCRLAPLPLATLGDPGTAAPVSREKCWVHRGLGEECVLLGEKGC